MAKKKKSKKAASAKKKFERRLIDILPLLLVGLILLVVVITMGIQYYDNRREKQEKADTVQRTLTTELNNVGNELDDLQIALEANSLAGKVTRGTYCYHESRKFEVGPLYCVQRLDIAATNTSDVQTLSDFARIYALLAENGQFDFVSDETLQSFDSDNRIFYYQGDKKNIGCSTDFTAYGEKYGNENSKNTYEVSIGCSGGEFEKPIYQLER